MAQAIAGSVRNIAAQQLLFPQFHQRKNRRRDIHQSLVLSDSRDGLGDEIVRGKGYLLFSTKRSQSSGHVNFTPQQRPKSQGGSRAPIHSISQFKGNNSKVTYVPIVASATRPLVLPTDSLNQGFELMKRLSHISRRKATESLWSPEDSPPHAIPPPKPKKLQISLILPSSTCPSEESEEMAAEVCKRKKPHIRAVSSIVGSVGDAMRKRIDAVAVGNNSPRQQMDKPMIKFSPSKGERQKEDLRKSLYKIRRTPRS